MDSILRALQDKLSQAYIQWGEGLVDYGYVAQCHANIVLYYRSRSMWQEELGLSLA